MAADYIAGWAMAEADSEEVRGALRARLGDSFEDVRLEAIWGLARRRDAEWLAILRARLAGDLGLLD
jgi:hypothetical protein